MKGHPLLFFLFSVECISWCWVGRSDWKKKPKKKNHKKSRNRRPWYPRMTLKVNIHTFGLTKCTIYCKKCSCFSLCYQGFWYFARSRTREIQVFPRNPAKSPKNHEILRNPPEIFPNTCRQNIFNTYLLDLFYSPQTSKFILKLRHCNE